MSLQGKYPAAGFSPIARTGRFAATLLTRYTDRDWLQPYVALVFRNTRIGAAVQYHSQSLQTRFNTSLQTHLHMHQYSEMNTRLQTNVTPRLSLTVLAWNTPPDRSDQSVQTLTAPHLRVLPEIQTLKTFVVKQATHNMEQLADQIFAQKKRVENRLEPSPAQSTLALTPAAKRVFRHPEPASADPAVITRVVEQQVAKKFQERKINPPVQGTPPAPIDINILADQVIRQIDHRIIAQRERLGKV